MHPTARSPWCVSSVLACGLLGSPGLVGLVAAFPEGAGHEPARATRGGHGVVGVNDGLLVAGSVHFGAVPIPNLCVELRGYKPGEGPDEKCAFRDGGTNTPSMAGCSSSWWGPSEAPPKFQHMQRTDDPGGSFAFVTPESGMVLVLAAYSHGGDYPTAVRFLQPRTGGGSTAAAAQHRRNVPSGIESGRLEVRINLSERTDMAELLLWSSSARENDHSPCALDSAVDADDGSATWGGTRVVPLSSRSGGLQSVPGWVNRHGQTGGNTPADSGINRLLIAGEGADGRETPTGLQQLAALLRSSCLNYGQQRGAGLWEANAAVCAIFHSALETEQAHESIVQNLAVFLEQVRCNVGLRRLAEVAIAFGAMLILLSKLVSCFFGSSSTSEDGYGHITEDGYGGISSASGNSEGVSDTMVGVCDSSIGGMSQLAIAAPGHLAESNLIENRRSDGWGRPKRVIANTADGKGEFDAFSSMFSTLDEMSRRVESKEVNSVVPPQSWSRDNYVVFEQ